MLSLSVTNRFSSLELPEAFDAIASLSLQLQALVSSAIAHPIWAIVCVVLGIGLLQLIADLMKRLLRAVVTTLLRLPLTLSQWIWAQIVRPKKNVQSDAAEKTSTLTAADLPVNDLLDRLNQLRREQDEIIEQLQRSILVAEPVEEAAGKTDDETALAEVTKDETAA